MKARDWINWVRTLRKSQRFKVCRQTKKGKNGSESNLTAHYTSSFTNFSFPFSWLKSIRLNFFMIFGLLSLSYLAQFSYSQRLSFAAALAGFYWELFVDAIVFREHLKVLWDPWCLSSREITARLFLSFKLWWNAQRLLPLLWSPFYCLS